MTNNLLYKDDLTSAVAKDYPSLSSSMFDNLRQCSAKNLFNKKACGRPPHTHTFSNLTILLIVIAPLSSLSIIVVLMKIRTRQILLSSPRKNGRKVLNSGKLLSYNPDR